MENEQQSTTPPANPLPNIVKKPAVLPLQSSPTDTSNWDDREFTTPSGKVVIETDQNSENKRINISE